MLALLAKEHLTFKEYTWVFEDYYTSREENKGSQKYDGVFPM